MVCGITHKCFLNGLMSFKSTQLYTYRKLNFFKTGLSPISSIFVTSLQINIIIETMSKIIALK